MFIRRLLSAPETAVLWPFTDNYFKRSYSNPPFIHSEMLRVYVASSEVPPNYDGMIACLAESKDLLDGSLMRPLWPGQEQRFRIDDVLPQNTRLVVANFCADLDSWKDSAAYKEAKLSADAAPHPVGFLRQAFFNDVALDAKMVFTVLGARSMQHNWRILPAPHAELPAFVTMGEIERVLPELRRLSIESNEMAEWRSSFVIQKQRSIRFRSTLGQPTRDTASSK